MCTSLLLAAALAAACPAAPRGPIGFSTARFVATLTVSYLPPYEGRPLAFRGGIETGPDLRRPFVGAAALAKYEVRLADGTVPARFRLRERVVVIDQHPELPERPPFDHAVEAVNGVITDLQLFGYEEDEVPVKDRPAERRRARGLWRRMRQELFVDGESQPFAVLEWKHTIRAVSLECAQAPARGR